MVVPHLLNRNYSFDIRLYAPGPEHGNGYKVSAAYPGNSTSIVRAIADVEYTRDDIKHLRDSLLTPLLDYIETSVPPDYVTEIGTRLARILLPDQIKRQIVEIIQNGEGINPTDEYAVRFCVSIDKALGALQDIPWEYLHTGLSDDFAGHLALNHRFSLHRKLECQNILPEFEAFDSIDQADPLRILIVHANPCTTAYPELQHVNAEIDQIRATFDTYGSKYSCEIEELPYATLSGLQRWLMERQPPHILHVICHGDTRRTGGVLVFHGERKGTSSFVYGEELAILLQNAAETLRLVVISACKTSSSQRGVAQELVDRGIPAVVAMHYQLRDQAAPVFSAKLYETLLLSQSIEQSVTAARCAIEHFGPDWGCPVLLCGDVHEIPKLTAKEIVITEPDKFYLPFDQAIHFYGRSEQMHEIDEILNADKSQFGSVAVIGMGGTGKTQLTVEYAYAHIADYSGGIYWLNARDSQQLLSDYETIGQLYFDLPKDIEPLRGIEIIQSRLRNSQERALFIYDNITSATDLSLILPNGVCDIIATTQFIALVRNRFKRRVAIERLNEKDSLVLMEAFRPIDGDDELSSAMKIAELLGHLPLALMLAGQYIHEHDQPYSKYLKRLEKDTFGELAHAREQFATATNHDGKIFDAIHLSFQMANRRSNKLAQKIMSVASCFAPRGIPYNFVQQASVIEDEMDFDDAIANLASSSLILRESRRQRFSIHELVRLYIHQQMTEDARSEAVKQVHNVITPVLAKANKDQSWHDVRVEIPHHFALLSLAKELEARDAQLLLNVELGEYELMHRNLTSSIKHNEYVLSLTSARQEGYEANIVRSLINLGEAHIHNDEYSTALKWFRKSLKLAHKTFGKDSVEAARCLSAIGVAFTYLRKYGRAKFLLKIAIGAPEQYKEYDLLDLAESLNNLGVAEEYSGDYPAALRYYQQSMEALENELGSVHPRIAILLNNIGRMLCLTRLLNEAKSAHLRALNIYECTYGRMHRNCGMCLRYLGMIEISIGNYPAAIDYLNQSIEIYSATLGESDRRITEIKKIIADLHKP